MSDRAARFGALPSLAFTRNKSMPCCVPIRNPAHIRAALRVILGKRVASDLPATGGAGVGGRRQDDL